MSSDPRRIANRRNALASTGPATPTGKAKAAQNAIKHGFFSRHLRLTEEESEEFTDLTDALTEDFKPASLIEAALVQKIAVCLWRQQRLLAAEAAQQELTSRRRLQMAYDLLRAPLPSPNERVEAYLNTLNDHELRYFAGDAHVNPLLDDDLSLAELAKIAPELMTRIDAAAANAGKKTPDYLAEVGGIKGFLTREVEQHRDTPADYANAAKAQALLQTIDQAPLSNDALIRAQSAIDNELYKALRQLREQQRWRFEAAVVTISTEPRPR